MTHGLTGLFRLLIEYLIICTKVGKVHAVCSDAIRIVRKMLTLL